MQMVTIIHNDNIKCHCDPANTQREHRAVKQGKKRLSLSFKKKKKLSSREKADCVPVRPLPLSV